MSRECLLSLLRSAEQGALSRRAFIAAVGAAAAVPVALRSTMSFAQAKELLLVNWGGDAIDAYTKAYGEPFEKEAGIKVRMDGSGPTEGAILAQAKSGSVTWDIVDVDPFSAITLGRQGILEPID